jgi:hypothetical protein
MIPISDHLSTRRELPRRWLLIFWSAGADRTRCKPEPHEYSGRLYCAAQLLTIMLTIILIRNRSRVHGWSELTLLLFCDFHDESSRYENRRELSRIAEFLKTLYVCCHEFTRRCISDLGKSYDNFVRASPAPFQVSDSPAIIKRNRNAESKHDFIFVIPHTCRRLRARHYMHYAYKRACFISLVDVN